MSSHFTNQTHPSCVLVDQDSIRVLGQHVCVVLLHSNLHQLAVSSRQSVLQSRTALTLQNTAEESLPLTRAKFLTKGSPARTSDPQTCSPEVVHAEPIPDNQLHTAKAAKTNPAESNASRRLTSGCQNAKDLTQHKAQ